MPQDERISARIDGNLKRSATKIFHRLGITEGEAIRMFYAQVKLHKGLPFRVEIPNKETIAAMDEAQSPSSLPSFKSFSELRKASDS